MTTTAKKRKSARRVGLVEQLRGSLAGAVGGVEKMVADALDTVESRAASVERSVRRLLARTLRDAGKQLRRLEKMVAPTPATKVGKQTKQTKQPKKTAAAAAKSVKRAAASVEKSLAA